MPGGQSDPLRIACVMDPDGSFPDLMARLRQGDEGTAAAIHRRFVGQLIALARRRMDSMVRAKVPPEDVVQSVFRTFFARLARGQFALDNWDSLWGMLALITVRKCARKARRFHEPGHDVTREVSLSGGPDPAGAGAALAREPTGEEAAVLAETLEMLLRGLEGAEREMLVLRLQGHSTREVSDALGCTERKVQRLLQRVRLRLERWREAGPDDS